MPTILIENHSLKPYEQRVLGTYVFIEDALKLLADKGADLRRNGGRPRPASRRKSRPISEADLDAVVHTRLPGHPLRDL